MVKQNPVITIGFKRRHSGVFIVNFEHISHLLVFLLLTLIKYMLAVLILFSSAITNPILASVEVLDASRPVFN